MVPFVRCAGNQRYSSDNESKDKTFRSFWMCFSVYFLSLWYCHMQKDTRQVPRQEPARNWANWCFKWNRKLELRTLELGYLTVSAIIWYTKVLWVRKSQFAAYRERKRILFKRTRLGAIGMCCLIIFLAWLQDYIPAKNRKFWSKGNWLDIYLLF